jgi:hypothetical protein
MIHLALTKGSDSARRRRPGAGRAQASDAAYRGQREALQCKDFSAVPVCGSVRPLASQRSQLAQPAAD